MNPDVSIIIPVYNVEKYIERCVKSLMMQDYENIEIILVNDGSLDDSTNIINKLSKEDSRIKILYQENSGVSAARNYGLRVALGDYIMFVDGDDWVDSDYVSYFLKLVKNNNCFIGMNKQHYSNEEIKYEHESNIVSAEKAIEWIYSDKIFVAVWNKIYKNDYLKRYNLIFNQNIWYGEGMLFNIECLQNVNKVAIGEKAIYHQTFNPESAMRNFNLKSNYCGISSMWLQRSKWKKVNKMIENEWIYHRYRFNRTIIDGLVRTNQVHDNWLAYKECVKNIRRGIFIPIKLEHKKKEKLKYLCYFLTPMFMARRHARKFSNAVKVAKQLYKY